ncbi:M20/M25/M40 family metallo-hydrolase [Sphingomonas quercus]|uniref:M20/M25/M40 family metallo-hydrolase n=1 Tax=Sphingomonas quercus TaxID=2842451 RepID=A0ABS6BDF6_9SPHN|nr:M20/M25/M40 family metallo-hydrolase [Sphingomonas quercus]MBU3076355.1 M20/M25/M40 family metallo-hydrolase [Sphingomonas quercus]
MRKRLAAGLAAAAALAGAAPAQGPATPGGREALAILQKAVAVPTVAGRGQVPVLARWIGERLVAGGFAAGDIAFTPVGETGYLTVRYPGRDRSARPIVLLGHIDVVEAKREDWQRDPFVPVIEGGYVYGRGALDDKGDVSILLAALLQLKAAGWVPGRDLVLALTGDEETSMASTRAAASALRNAELVLNADAGGGLLDKDGKPIAYRLQAAEKTYAEYVLTVTDPGGHSSRPGKVNAIYRLGAGLARLASFQFPPELSPVTRAYFEASAPRTPGPLGAAMKAFAANPRDAAAAATLSDDPEYVGLVRTTCVATMIDGGHAPNALPQRAEAVINCRIFPGTSIAAIEAQLKQIVADPGIAVAYRDAGTLAAPESPLRADVVKAVTDAVHARAPGLPILPAMEAGATDSMHFRALGVPAYGVASIFMKSEDDRAHGLDERLPLATLDAGVAQWQAVLKALAR